MVSSELSNEIVVPFVKVEKILLVRLAVWKVGCITETKSNKERALCPVFQTFVPGFGVTYDMEECSVRIALVDCM